MEIKLVEKIILTKEEKETLDNACDIIDELYRISPSTSKLDKQLSNLLASLSDFIDDVEVM